MAAFPRWLLVRGWKVYGSIEGHFKCSMDSPKKAVVPLGQFFSPGQVSLYAWICVVCVVLSLDSGCWRWPSWQAGTTCYSCLLFIFFFLRALHSCGHLGHLRTNKSATCRRPPLGSRHLFLISDNPCALMRLRTLTLGRFIHSFSHWTHWQRGLLGGGVVW